MAEDQEKALLQRRLARAKKAQAEAEHLLEEKSRELYLVNEELKSLNLNLEKSIAERTADFESARDKAVAASQAKSQFLANMSHEIRTPLNGMLGFVNVLGKTALDPSQRGYLKTIFHSGELLLSIINDILEFSRIEAGHLDIEERPFDLRECVEGLIEVLAIQAYEKGLEVPICIEGDVASKVLGDEGRLRQVLVNLIGNAIKFTHFGEVSISVGVAGADLKFTIADTGVGIPESKKDTIFAEFSQTDESDTRKYGGSGLGLTISKKILEAMGGEIGVESCEGKGSCFFFTIPYRPQGPSPETFLERGVRVAVVAQNATVRGNLLKRIRSWQGEVEAFKAFRSAAEPIDVSQKTHVLIDSQCFGGLSEEAKNALKLRLKGQHVAVVVSPGADCEASDWGLSTEIFVKPIRRRQLFQWLSQEEGNAQRSLLKSEKVAGQESCGRRVLVVEDNLINQQLMEVVLEVGGYQCVLAGDGQEAVEKYKTEGPFDAILMDCQMPVMDGFEATKEIRQWDAGETVPIIALTANAFRATQEKCFSVGMNDFITKPVKDEDLYECIDKNINKNLKTA